MIRGNCHFSLKCYTQIDQNIYGVELNAFSPNTYECEG